MPYLPGRLIRAFLLVLLIPIAVRANTKDAFTTNKAVRSLISYVDSWPKSAKPVVNPTLAEVISEPTLYLRQVESSLRNGEVDEIESIARLLVEANPRDAKALALLSIHAAATGSVEEARSQLAKARNGVGSPGYLIPAAEGMILRLEGKPGASIQACRRGLAMDAAHPYLLNVLGRAYLDQNDLTNAWASFGEAVRVAPSFVPAHINLGATLLLLGDVPRATQSYQNAVSLDARDLGARCGLAMAFEAAGNIQASMAELQRVVSVATNHPIALPRLAQLQLQTGQLKEAIASGERMLHIGEAGALELLADASLQLGDLPKSTGYLSKMESSDPARSYLQCYAQLVKGQDEAALTTARETLRLDSNNAGAHIALLALNLHLGGRIDETSFNYLTNSAAYRPFLQFVLAASNGIRGKQNEALNHFRAAEGFIPGFSVIGLSQSDIAKGLPSDQYGQLLVGTLLYSKGLFLPSYSRFNSIANKNADAFLANYLAGAAASKLGNASNALHHFESATGSAPTFFAGLFAAGESNFGMGKVDRAAEFYRRAKAVKPDVGLALRLGVYYENRGKLVEAEEEYRTAVRLSPDFFAANNQLAWFLAVQGRNLNEAYELAQRANRSLPGNASILDTLGWISFLRGQNDLAHDHLTKASAANPNNPTIWYHLGVVQHARKKPAEARDALTRALSISGEFNDQGNAKRLLDSLR